MSKASKTLRSLEPGDVVKTERTLKFTGQVIEAFNFEDVISGDEFYLNPDYLGSLKIEMVKRVSRRAPQRQDFEPGDVLTGHKLKAVMWKRGSIFRAKDTNPGHGIVLRSDGMLYPLTNTYGNADFDGAFGFNDLNPNASFVIEYLP